MLPLSVTPERNLTEKTAQTNCSSHRPRVCLSGGRIPPRPSALAKRRQLLRAVDAGTQNCDQALFEKPRVIASRECRRRRAVKGHHIALPPPCMPLQALNMFDGAFLWDDRENNRTSLVPHPTSSESASPAQSPDIPVSRIELRRQAFSASASKDSRAAQVKDRNPLCATDDRANKPRPITSKGAARPSNMDGLMDIPEGLRCHILTTVAQE